MFRKQIYLNEKQVDELNKLSILNNLNHSEIIREAIDLMYLIHTKNDMFTELFGMWQDNDIDLQNLRSECNRYE